MRIRLCHHDNSKVVADNSSGENDNTHRGKRQQQKSIRPHPLTTVTSKIKMYDNTLQKMTHNDPYLIRT